jgi:hypothetical protein
MVAETGQAYNVLVFVVDTVSSHGGGIRRWVNSKLR